MNELSLHILDIAQNSIKAGATDIQISVVSQSRDFCMDIAITDNGCGMDAPTLERAVSPFATSRTTRKVGLGLPLLKMTAEMTGGSFSISSTLGAGTQVCARYKTDSVDCLPLGNMADTIMLLVQQKPNNRFLYKRSIDDRQFIFDTYEVREILGDIPLDTHDVLSFINEYVQENERTLMEVLGK